MSNVPECDKNATVFVGKACLYKYTYCPWGTQDDVVQIGVGIITKIHGGGNLMIEILRQVLNDLDEKNELPTKNPKFYLQVDNCGDNKNKTLFAFLVDLVK